MGWSESDIKLIELYTGAAKIPHAVIGGTRIRVSLLAALVCHYREDGMTEQEARAGVVKGYTQLSELELDAAMQYWSAHPEEIEREMNEDAAAFAGLEMLQRSLERVHSHR